MIYKIHCQYLEYLLGQFLMSILEENFQNQDTRNNDHPEKFPPTSLSSLPPILL